MVDTIFVVGLCSDKLALELLPALCYALGVFSGLAIFPYVMARAGLGFKTLKKPKYTTPKKSLWEKTFGEARNAKPDRADLVKKMHVLTNRLAGVSDKDYKKLRAELDEVTRQINEIDRADNYGRNASATAAVLNSTTSYQKIESAEIEIPVIAEDVLVYQAGELGASYPDVTRLFYSAEALQDPEYLETVTRSPLQVQTHEKNTSEFNRGVDGWPLSAWWDETERRVKVRGIVHGEDNVAYVKENRNKPNFGTSAYISFLEIDRTPGTAPNGKPYDAIVRKAVNNHIAILPNVRDPKNVILAMNAVKGSADTAYKKYLIKTNHLNGSVSISRDGHHIAYASSTEDAKKQIDGLNAVKEKPMQDGKNDNALEAEGVNSMDIKQFIQQNKVEIDRRIKAKSPSERLDDENRRLWLLNDEGLYSWAKSKGADVGNALEGMKEFGVHNAQDWRSQAEAEFGRGLSVRQYEEKTLSAGSSSLRALYRELVQRKENQALRVADGRLKNAKNNQEKKNVDYDEFKGHMNAYEQEKDSENQLVEKVTNAVLEKMNASKNEDKPADEKPAEEKKEAGNADEGKAANALPSESMVKDFSDALGITFKTTPSLKELALVAGVNGAGSPAELIAALNAKRETLRKPAAASAQNSSGAPVSIDDLIKQM